MSHANSQQIKAQSSLTPRSKH